MFTLTRDSLRQTWESAADCGDESCALSTLQAQFGFPARTSDKGGYWFYSQRRHHVLSSLCSCIAQTLREELTYVISFLAIVGIYGLIRGANCSIFKAKAGRLFKRLDGTGAFYIPHDLCGKQERLNFEEAYVFCHAKRAQIKYQGIRRRCEYGFSATMDLWMGVAGSVTGILGGLVGNLLQHS